MKSALIPALAPLAFAAFMSAVPSFAADGDEAFFRSVAGEWVGPGEIVAGKYKGTRFVCTFTGSPSSGKTGVLLDGGCRVGVFTQKMTATVEREGSSYHGKFQDGAEGKGLDIISGNVVDGRKLVLAINRKQLHGAMLAKLPDPNTMTVTVSVNVDSQLIPVIGVNLKRVDGAAVGSVSSD